MRRSPLIIAGTILLCGSVLFWRGALQTSRLKRDLLELAARTSALELRMEDAPAKLRACKAAVAAARGARSSAVGQLARERASRPEPDVESLWSEPPNHLPAWESDSPYVWISKEMLRMLPVTPFEPSGRFSSPVAATLALSGDKLEALDHALAKIVSEYHDLQVAAAHPSTDHLTSDAGQKVTVVLDPEPESGAKRLRDAFEGTLRADLTPQQFELARSLGRFWMDQNLLPENAEPKFYTVVRHPDGTFALTVKGRSEWSSMSGFTTLEHYVPDYLLPFFAGLQQSSGPE